MTKLLLTHFYKWTKLYKGAWANSDAANAEVSAHIRTSMSTSPRYGCPPLLMTSLCLQPAVQSIKPLSRLDDEWFVMFCPSALLPKKCMSAIYFVTFRGGDLYQTGCECCTLVFLRALYVILTQLKACSVAHILAALACKHGLFTMWRAPV